jgi:hypothetical protein
MAAAGSTAPAKPTISQARGGDFGSVFIDCARIGGTLGEAPELVEQGVINGSDCR